MYWDVVNIKAIAPRTLQITFSDGLAGSIMIDKSFCTGVFTVLNDDAEIDSAFVENWVVTWQNGLDLAPDTLYKEIKNNPNRHYVITGKNI